MNQVIRLKAPIIIQRQTTRKKPEDYASLTRDFFSFDREAIDEPDGSLRVQGTLATNTDSVVHWLPGIGRARVKLRIAKAMIKEWRDAGITDLPILRDHGSWFGASIEDVLGRIENLRVDDGRLDADWVFDPDLAKDRNGNSLFGPIRRKVLSKVSVGFQIFEVRLLEEKSGSLPLYEAVKWRAHEGSLVWMGADPGAKLRKQGNMNEEEIRALIAAAVKDAAKAGAEEAVRAMQAAAPPSPVEEKKNEQPASTDAEPAKAETDAERFTKVMDIARRDLGADMADELMIRANGNPIILGELIKSAKSRQDASKAQVPTNGAGGITGGDERKMAVFGDLVTILRARGMQPGDDDPEKLREKAEKVSPYWRNMSIVAVVRRAAKETSRMRKDAIDHMPARDLLKRFIKESSRREFNDYEIVNGSRYLRMTEGLVPADLPSAFQDIMHKTLMSGYDKERDLLPLDQLAVRKDVEDFRTHKVIEMDLEGQFRELAKEERFRPLALREAEHEFSVKQYGFTVKLSFRALINDDLDALVQVPMLAGMWHAQGENRTFQAAVENGTRADGTSVYSGDNLQSVADINAYATNWEAVWKLALAADVVGAMAGHDPKQHTVRTQALAPTILLYGINHEFPLTSFFDQRNGSGEKFADPADEVRHSFLRRLWNNRYLGLYMDADTQIMYPGPTSGVCPVMYGRLVGEGGPVTEIGDTDFNEFPGIQMSIRATFNALVDKPKRAYKIVAQ